MCNLFQALYDHGQQLADHQWMEHPAVMYMERIKNQEEQEGRKQKNMKRANGRKEKVQQEDQITITEHHLEEKIEVEKKISVPFAWMTFTMRRSCLVGILSVRTA